MPSDPYAGCKPFNLSIGMLNVIMLSVIVPRKVTAEIICHISFEQLFNSILFDIAHHCHRSCSKCTLSSSWASAIKQIAELNYSGKWDLFTQKSKFSKFHSYQNFYSEHESKIKVVQRTDLFYRINFGVKLFKALINSVIKCRLICE